MVDEWGWSKRLGQQYLTTSWLSCLYKVFCVRTSFPPSQGACGGCHCRSSQRSQTLDEAGRDCSFLVILADRSRNPVDICRFFNCFRRDRYEPKVILYWAERVVKGAKKCPGSYFLKIYIACQHDFERTTPEP